MSEQTSAVLQEIVQERAHQIEIGFTPAHDDRHTGGELVSAAVCYATGAKLYLYNCTRSLWPFDDSDWHPESPRTNLIKAAAMLVAEIERLDRWELS